MSQPVISSSDRDTCGQLQISRADAQIILDALKALLNIRRFSFKEPEQDPRALYSDVAEALEHVQAEFDRAFGNLRATE